MVETVATPWAPKDTEELLNVIAEDNYGVFDGRSAELARIGAPPIRAAIRAYNAKADTYAQVVQKQGQPLREGFSIAMVRAARSLSLLGVASREMQSRDIAMSRDHGRSCPTLPWHGLSGDAIS